MYIIQTTFLYCYQKSYGECAFPIIVQALCLCTSNDSICTAVKKYFTLKTKKFAGTDDLTVADIALVATYSTIKACEGVTDLSSYEVGYHINYYIQ